MHLTIKGGGYLGIISAICFKELGFDVDVVDINPDRIKNLEEAIPSVFEPGLSSLLKKYNEKKEINFSMKDSDFIDKTDAIIVTVEATAFNKAMSEIALALRKDRYVAILIKTAISVDTCSMIANYFKDIRPDLIPQENYDIIANPELIREGFAIHDFMSPDRMIIGLEKDDSPKAKKFISKLYKSFIDGGIPFVYTDFKTAQLIRHATVGLMLTKITYMNELADLSKKVGADIDMLIKGIGLDPRVGQRLLRPSPGFGGSSYIKSPRILLETADKFGVDLLVLKNVIKSNQIRISQISKDITKQLDKLEDSSNKKVAILGLTYKALSSIISNSPSIFVIENLLKSDLEVVAYDPCFRRNSVEINEIPKNIISNNKFQIVNSVYDAVNQSDIAVIMTNWPEFTEIDLQKVSELMNKKLNRKPIIMDYRNMFTLSKMKDFDYISQGRN